MALLIAASVPTPVLLDREVDRWRGSATLADSFAHQPRPEQPTPGHKPFSREGPGHVRRTDWPNRSGTYGVPGLVQMSAGLDQLAEDQEVPVPDPELVGSLIQVDRL
jgi:hypothetical protein